MIPIYVGYDERERVGYPVFCQSVLARTRAKVSFTPVRGDHVVGSTRFNAERWAIAADRGYRGWAIWAECDMLCRADLEELWALRSERYDVLIAPHDYKTKFPVKFLGQKNPDYPKKNQSSLMLINCTGRVWERIAEVDPRPGAELHQFPAKLMNKGRLDEGFRVGHLDLTWNWLVSEYDYNPKAKIAHFTVGLPIWPEYAQCDYSDEWFAERESMLAFDHSSR